MPIRALLFDLDNTLWNVGAPPDWDAITALQAAALEPHLVRLGLGSLDRFEFVRRFWDDYVRSFRDDLDPLLDPPLEELRWLKGASMLRKTLAECGGECSEGDSERLWEALHAVPLHHFNVRPFSDAISTVEALSARGYRLGIVTDRPLPATIVARELRDQRLPEVFEIIVTAGEVGYRKQHPLAFESALKLLGIAADAAVVVGDSYEDDIVPAAKLGMIPVLKLNDRPTDANWALARYQIPSLAALLELDVLRG